MSALEQHQLLVSNLLKLFQQTDPQARLLQTHISSVILFDQQAWKLKKPVNFGFLDFTDAAQRAHFCAEELRLNQALSDGLYLHVAPIYGTAQAPSLQESGEALEHAVVMRRFDDGERLDEVLLREGLPLEHMDTLATRIAQFHTQAPRVNVTSMLGKPEIIYHPMQQNFEQIQPLLEAQNDAAHAQLEGLRIWTESQFTRMKALLAQRKAQGFVRELHGDMHLANMARMGDRIIIFDAIEFNDSFRWIDVMSELAFLLMDLQDRGLPAHASRLLNCYLEHTGDYAGLALLRFYQTYRAMVRAKVALLGIAFGGSEEAVAAARRQYQRYADLAEHFTTSHSPCLVITHGYSASGKSHASLVLAESAGMIRVRADIERQRLYPERGDPGLNQGRYSAEATSHTYQRLLDIAASLLDAGFGVILDATYLKAAQREAAHQLAKQHACPFYIIDIECPSKVLEQRLLERNRLGNDVSEATLEVLHAQQSHAETLTTEEKPFTLQLRCDAPIEAQMAAVLERMRMTHR